jgi:hypothetical protein
MKELVVKTPIPILHLAVFLLMGVVCIAFLAFVASYSKYTSVQTDPCSLLTKAEAEQLLGRLAREPSSSQGGSSMWRTCFYETGQDELQATSLLVGVAEFQTEKSADEALDAWATFSGVAVDQKQEVADLGRRAVYRAAKSNRDYNTAPHDTVEFYVTARTYLIRFNLLAFDRPARVDSVRPLVEQALKRLP